MSTTETRRTFLDKLLGKKEPDSVSEAMAKLEAALDEKGVDRKELDVDKTKGLLEKIVADMAKVVGKLSDDSEMVANISNELAAAAIGALLEASAGTPIEDEVEDLVEGEETETETETMAEDDEEDEEEVPEKLMELTEQVKALADESNESMKAMKELIPAVVDALKMVEKLQPIVDDVETIKSLVSRVESVESLFKQRPRAASSAQETVVENDKLKSQIKKGAEEQKTLLGFPVKSQ